MTPAEAELGRAAAAWDEACREASVAADVLCGADASHATRTYLAALIVANDLGAWLDDAIAAWDAEQAGRESTG